MAQAPSPAEQRAEQREQREQTATPQLVVVDLGRRQNPKQVRRLRKGRGKLVRRIDAIVGELIEAGTIKANVQPVVIVVRERTSLPWPLDAVPDDDDDDDN